MAQHEDLLIHLLVATQLLRRVEEEAVLLILIMQQIAAVELDLQERLSSRNGYCLNYADKCSINGGAASPYVTWFSGRLIRQTA